VFRNVYNITKGSLDNLCNDVKLGIVNSSKEFTDQSIVSRDDAKKARVFASQSFGISLAQSQVFAKKPYINIVHMFLRLLLLYYLIQSPLRLLGAGSNGTFIYVEILYRTRMKFIWNLVVIIFLL
jgi:hypothetical protein